MKLERLVLIAGGGSMIVGAVAAVLGMLLHWPELRILAIWSLGAGVVIGFLPLTLSLALIAYKRVAGRQRRN
jgi:energy-converting hydrogenase Eha subunit E